VVPANRAAAAEEDLTVEFMYEARSGRPCQRRTALDRGLEPLLRVSSLRISKNDATNREQTLLARARLDANYYVGSLLRVPDNSIANASNLCALRSSCADQLNLTNLRGLSFRWDTIIPREGSVCCSVDARGRARNSSAEARGG
jgi:hypothetical protein